MGATDLETRMQEYHEKACDSGYTETYLYATIGSRSLRWWLEEPRPKGKVMAKFIQAYSKGCSPQNGGCSMAVLARRGYHRLKE